MLTVLLTGCGSSGASASPSAAESYGTLPTFLPSIPNLTNEPVAGSTSTPAVASQGDSIRIEVAGNTATVTVTGPEVPGQGLPAPPPATTCTFTVTVTGALRPLPMSLSMFNAIDHLGAVYHLAAVPDEPAPPPTVEPGRTVSFRARTVMPTGEGLLQFAPDRRHVVASWDFVVEND